MERRGDRQSALGYKAKVPESNVVEVRLELLRNLKEHNNILENYVQGYLVCADLFRDCIRIRQLLTRGTREKKRLVDSLYWEGIRDVFDHASPLALNLLNSLGLELGNASEKLEQALQDAKRAVNDAIHQPAGFDPMSTVNEANCSVDIIWDAVESFVGKTQAVTKAELKEVGEIVARIDESIEHSRTLADERNKVDQWINRFTEKLQLEAAQKEAISRASLEMGRPLAPGDERKGGPTWTPITNATRGE